MLGRLGKFFAVIAAVATFSSAHAAVDGNTYAVIAPTYRASTGAESYIRFFSGGSAASTFTVRVVGSPSGNTYGTTTVVVPKNAELQRSLSTLLTASGSGALASGDTGYSIYLQNPDASAGYQHVIFSSVTLLFENASNCKTPLNQVMGSVSNNAALIGVHTTVLSGYPSTIYLHNYRSIPVAYRATVVDAATGTAICPPGSSTCTLTMGVAANETLTTTFQQIQSDLSWTPTSSQPHANILFSDPTLNSAPQMSVAQAIRNNTLNGNIDLSTACAVNPPAANNPIATAASTIFDGTIASNTGSGSITVTIQGSGSASTSGSERPASVESPQAVERQQASLTATGAFRLQGGTSNVALTGTYNSLTNALSLSGAGYTFDGSVAGTSSVSGFYTGPNNIAGTFAMAPGTATSKPTTYCGTYLEGSTVGGKFNMAINSTSGTVTGSYKPTSDPGGTISGSVTSAGNFTASTNDGTAITGTFSANGTSGTYQASDGSGTFSGSVCTTAR